MGEIDALILFARVVEAGSFSDAARRLHVPVSTVSRRVAELEDKLGVRLLERTTRRLRVTSLGDEVLAQARRGVEIEEAVASIVSERRSSVMGLLRVAAPPSISDTLVAPTIGAFQLLHPAVRFDIVITDKPVDLVADEIDLSFQGGAIRDISLVARKLLTYRHQLVASPAYVAAHDPCRASF